jgi:hypothetical protein
VRNQCGAAPEQKMTKSAFGDRKPVAGHDRRVGKTSGSPGRRIKNVALKHVDRTLPINQNDSGGTDPTRSSRSADLAFQHAVRRAIAQGLERPPMIGLIKDTRPLNAPRLFEPVLTLPDALRQPSNALSWQHTTSSRLRRSYLQAEAHTIAKASTCAAGRSHSP